MLKPAGKVLLICYGNPGRRDDGLGPVFAEALEKIPLTGVSIDADYQLTVEDAAEIAEHEITIFVDATVNGAEPFFFRRIAPKSVGSFSSHCVGPEMLLAMAEELFHARCQGFALGIRGYEFNEFGEWLSAQAQQNLAAALQFMVPVLKKRNFTEVATEGDESPESDETAYYGEPKCKTENM